MVGKLIKKKKKGAQQQQQKHTMRFLSFALPPGLVLNSIWGVFYSLSPSVCVFIYSVPQLGKFLLVGQGTRSTTALVPWAQYLPKGVWAVLSVPCRLPAWRFLSTRSWQPERMHLLLETENRLEAPLKPPLLQLEGFHTYRLALGKSKTNQTTKPTGFNAHGLPSSAGRTGHAASRCGKTSCTHGADRSDAGKKGKKKERLSLSPVAQEKRFPSAGNTAFRAAAAALLSLPHKNVLSLFFLDFLFFFFLP